MKPLIPTTLLSCGMLALGALAPAGAALAQCADITISPTTLPDGQQGAGGYSVPFTATNAGGEPIWQAFSLPPGLTLSSNGTLAGTPQAAGSYPIRVVVGTTGGCLAGQYLVLNVTPAPTFAAVISIARTDTAEPDPQSLNGAMTITDPAPAASYTATIGVNEGTLDIAAGTNTVTVAGNASDEVTLTGTLADVDAVLAGANGATVNYLAAGTPFFAATLTLAANNGTDTVTATGIVSGPTVLGPRVMVIPPNTTRTLPVIALDAQGNTVNGSPYSYSSSAVGIVAVNGSGQLTSNTALNFAQITAESPARRPAKPWVSVNNIVAVTVGSTIPASIASTDGFSAFGSNQFLPTTSYYADIYTIALTMGQSVTIEADSGDDLDTYLIMADPDGYVVATNDDDDTGALGVGSRIDFVAPADGTYYIEQSTFNGLDTGAYTLRVSAGPPPPRPGTATKPQPRRTGAKR